MSDLLRFIYCPTEASYSFQKSARETSRISLDGGSGRYRKRINRASKLVECRWVVDAVGYNYIKAHERIFAQNPMPFSIDLVIDDAFLEDCEAWLASDEFKLTEKLRGRDEPLFVLTAQLEVIPPESCFMNDMNLVCVVNGFGPNWMQCADKLDWLTNTYRPTIFPYEETAYAVR